MPDPDEYWLVEHYFDSDGVELKHFASEQLAKKWVEMNGTSRDVIHPPASSTDG